MLKESGLNLRSGQTVPRDVDNIVNAATDPVVTIVVTAGTISSELFQSVMWISEPG